MGSRYTAETLDDYQNDQAEIQAHLQVIVAKRLGANAAHATQKHQQACTD